MKLDEKFYSMFLEEMSSLEGFRQNYAAAHSSVALQEEEPDVKRLIEAMAFFTGRTHKAALDNVVATKQRIFQQHYPFLLRPMPSMAILQACPTARCAEPVFVPNGTEMSFRTNNGKVAMYRTMQDLNILPLTQGNCRSWLLNNGGTRVQLIFDSFYPRNDNIGELRLGINYLNNYYTSLQLIDAFKKHLRKVSVTFEKDVHEETDSTACSYSFGANEEDEQFSYSHPVEKLRRFFHFPRTDLYFNVRIPKPPRNWSRFSILLDLDSKWPKKMTIHKDAFVLSSVPVINLNRESAAPFTYDATEDSQILSHPEPNFKYELHSIRAAMRVTDEGMEPLRAGILSGGNGSYELEYTKASDGNMHNQLKLNLPEAFQENSTIVADANWYQPWFSAEIAQKIDIFPYRRNFIGIDWQVSGNIVPHEENPMAESLDSFVQVLSLKNKAKFNYDDIMFMLKMLGCIENGAFKDISKLLKGVKVTEGSTRRSKSLLPAYFYKLEFREYDPNLEPIVQVFRERFAEFLKVWATESEIEVIK
jgi:type VI secretion system protein ImpG